MVRIRKKNLSAHRDSLLISQKKKKSDEDRDVQPILYDEVDVIEEGREENEEDDQQQQIIDPNESACKCLVYNCLKMYQLRFICAHNVVKM
jgi:hypothetical protein